MPKDSSHAEKVKVVCRIRPETLQEVERQGAVCVKHNNTSVEVTLDEASYPFSFDQIFGPKSKQQDIFEFCAVPLVHDVLEGYNATIFAYGQTSSGKTYTMEGTDIRDPDTRGIIPRAIEALFAGVSEADENIEFCFKATYVEIYCEKVRDLLDNHRVKDNLTIREDKVNGIYISGVTEKYVGSEEELLDIMSAGAINRAVAATGMNEGSSRSHSVFSITVSQRDMSTATSKSGKLVLVDLAGSETVRKTQSSGQQLEEAKMINKSLSALGQVIYALTDAKATHIPYRDSKLTRILQDSLGGNSKTALIVACSPSSYNGSETVSTLRFGMRAKNIENKVIKNETRSVEELEALLEKAERAIDTQGGHIMALVSQLQGYIDSGEEAGAVDNSALIEKQQADIQNLQDALDEEKEESRRKDHEIASLNQRLNEKEAVLSEAGLLLEEAQSLYASSKTRAESLAAEKSALQGRLDTLNAETADELSKLKFQMEELQVNLENATLENQTLCKELAELTGDDVRPRELINNSSKVSERSNTPPQPPGGGKNAAIAPRSSTEQSSTSAHSAAAAAKGLNMAVHREGIEVELTALQKLVRSLELPSASSEKIMEWAHGFTASGEIWLQDCEAKFNAMDRIMTDNKKRIKELETQRSRFEKDLQIRTEKVMQQQLEIEVIRNTPESQDAMQLMQGREQYQMKSLQQRLEQLVAVHRQLLRKYSSLELENGELRKKLLLRDNRIKLLESNAKGMTSNIRQQAERHIAELTDLRESIQEMKMEHNQRLESSGTNTAPKSHNEGRKIIRGGVHRENSDHNIPSPKAVRGGGGKSGRDSDNPQPNQDSSAPGKHGQSLMSRLWGGK